MNDYSTLTDAELSAAIHRADDERGPSILTPTSAAAHVGRGDDLTAVYSSGAVLSDLLREERRRTAEHAARVHELDAAAHGPDSWTAPLSGVTVDRRAFHGPPMVEVVQHGTAPMPWTRTRAIRARRADRAAVNRRRWVALVAARRARRELALDATRIAAVEHVAPMVHGTGRAAALARLTTELRPASGWDHEWRADVLPDQFDGGAYALATHRTDADGREVPSPHYVQLGSVIAQASDVRATLLARASWKGGTGRVEDEWSGALADGTRSARQCTTALYGPDGCNGLHNGTRVHWQPVRVEAERRAVDVVGALLALVGHDVEVVSRYSDDDDGKRIVGAVEVAPRASHTLRAVRVQYLTGRIRDGVPQVSSYVRPLSAAVRRGALWSHFSDRHELPWTAKLVTRRVDQRQRARTDERREVERSSKARSRFTAAAVSARTQLVDDGKLTGRSNSRHVVVARSAVTLSVLARLAGHELSAVEVLDTWCADDVVGTLSVHV